MIKSSNEVDIYEVDGQESAVPVPRLLVSNHWNRDSLVVLEVHGKRLTVSARDLQAAIANATNVNKWP